MKNKKPLKLSVRFRANRGHLDSLYSLASMQGISTAKVIRNLIEAETEKLRIR